MPDTLTNESSRTTTVVADLSPVVDFFAPTVTAEEVDIRALQTPDTDLWRIRLPGSGVEHFPEIVELPITLDDELQAWEQAASDAFWITEDAIDDPQ